MKLLVVILSLCVGKQWHYSVLMIRNVDVYAQCKLFVANFLCDQCIMTVTIKSFLFLFFKISVCTLFLMYVVCRLSLRSKQVTVTRI